MKITLPAQLYKVSSKVDRSYVLTFATRELTGSEAAGFLGEIMNEGWLVWGSNAEEELTVPDEKADSMLGNKTQAQRLRAVLYRIFEQSGKKGDFEDFYRSKMENIIDQLKEKLQ